MAVVTGVMQTTYNHFLTLLQNDQFGEIQTDDDLVFGNGTSVRKWKKAMEIHTAGKPLIIPSHYSRGNGHSTIPPTTRPN